MMGNSFSHRCSQKNISSLMVSAYGYSCSPSQKHIRPTLKRKLRTPTDLKAGTKPLSQGLFQAISMASILLDKWAGRPGQQRGIVNRVQQGFCLGFLQPVGFWRQALDKPAWCRDPKATLLHVFDLHGGPVCRPQYLSTARIRTRRGSSNGVQIDSKTMSLGGQMRGEENCIETGPLPQIAKLSTTRPGRTTKQCSGCARSESLLRSFLQNARLNHQGFGPCTKSTANDVMGPNSGLLPSDVKRLPTPQICFTSPSIEFCK